MKRRWVIQGCAFALAAAMLGLVPFVFSPRAGTERIAAQISSLQPVIRATLKACYTRPSDGNLAKFRTAVLEMRRLISSADCPAALRKEMQSDLVEAVSIASGIFGDHRAELRGLSPTLVGW